MEVFADYLTKINIPAHQERMEEVLTWVDKQFPSLEPTIKWNQPMFTDHGTYIIGFSVAKHHLAVAPEEAGITRFSDQIAEAGYAHTKQLIRIPWDRPVNFSLFQEMITFNMMDKADCLTFWRK